MIPLFIFDLEQNALANNDDVQTGEVTASSLNVRAQPTTSSNVIGSLSKGNKVSLYELSRNWYKVKVNNQTGYIHSDYVSVTTESLSGRKGEITATKLNVRSQASTYSTVVGSLTKGTVIDLHERTGSWFKVKVNNQWAYIHSDYVKVSSGSSGSGSDSVSEQQKGEITASRLNIRSQASTSSNVIGSLTNGTVVDLHEQTGSWFKVSVNNQWGFIHSDYVKTSGGSSGSDSNSDTVSGHQKGEVTASRLNVRSQASTSSNVIGSLTNGTVVDLYEQSGNWFKVKVNSQWGFIHSDYVKTSGGSAGSESATEQQKGEITASRLNVRSQASTSSNVIRSLTNGTVIDLHEQSGSWFKVNVNNQWGYIHSDYVNPISVGSTPSNGQLNGKTIFLDPGHGGNDSGAVTGNDQEKTLALQISNKLKSELESLGAEVISSRTNDRYVALGERVNMANNTNADIFVSIHLNSFSDPNVSGTEAFYNTVHAPKNSKQLASSIQNRLVSELNLRDRNVKNANFEVIRYTKMPSSLVEIGFMTNAQDLNIIKNDQDKVVNSLKNGIVDYFN